MHFLGTARFATAPLFLCRDRFKVRSILSSTFGRMCRVLRVHVFFLKKKRRKKSAWSTCSLGATALDVWTWVRASTSDIEAFLFALYFRLPLFRLFCLIFFSRSIMVLINLPQGFLYPKSCSHLDGDLNIAGVWTQ